MSIAIRNIEKQDCARLLELVHELAVYEKAPEEVTVTLEHFIESGFGQHPVWWGFVAEGNDIIIGFVYGYWHRFANFLLYSQLPYFIY